jgi:hypothetical protein
MKMLSTVVCLCAGAVLLADSAPAVASGKSAKERQLRYSQLQSSQGYRPDYYEHLVDKHQVGSPLWWELTRRNRR